MSPGSAPVVLLAFANDRIDGQRYLRNLPREQKRIRAALEKAQNQQLCELIERPNATVDEMLDVFQKSRNRVALFHFAGHAGSAKLFFESLEGATTVAHAGGLAAFLSQQRGLALVFLNGCSSEGQVKGLLEAGVALVIATSQAIDDGVATDFAARFYQGLATGGTIRTAFREAEAAVQSKRGHPRDAYRTNRDLQPTDFVEDRWPWRLFEGSEAAGIADRWTLGVAAQTTRRNSVDIPSLLPYMANRSCQRDQLAEALDRHRTDRPRRPFVTLVYGDEREAHQGFVDRLQCFTLPKLLGLRGDSHVEPENLEWSEPRGTLVERRRRLDSHLAETIAGDRYESLETMARVIATHRCPVMISTKVYSQDWQGNESKLVRNWLDWWEQEWPDLPTDQWLLIVISFVLKDGSRESFWDRRKITKRNRQVCEFVESLGSSAFRGITVATLDKLEGISERHVQEWIRNEAAEFCYETRGAIGDSVVLEEKLGQWISDLFRESKDLTEAGGIPMRILADKLRDELQHCMNEGGI